AGATSIFQNNTLGELIFMGAAVGIHGTGSYVQSGPGTVSLQATSGNTYTGSTFLNGGVTEIAGDSQLGGTLVGNYTGNLDNGTTAHPIVLVNNGGGVGATAGTTLTVDGLVSGAAGT